MDIFCGGGLFSYAARAAGMKVIFGVDNESSALLIFKANFPEAKAVCATVGPGSDDEVTTPGPAPNRHIHLSPPCTQISSANTACRDKQYGISALKWAIETAMSGYESWSIETVVSGSSHSVVNPLKEKHKTDGLFDSTELDSQDFGDPQSRRRLILGPKWLIDALRAAPTTPVVSVREAYKRAKMPIPSGATHTKNASTSKDGSNVRPLERPSFTVCAARANSFCRSDGQTVKSMSSEQSRVLMGLDSSFELRGKAVDSQRVLGNGVTFNVARAIALAAQKRAITFPQPLPGMYGRGGGSGSSSTSGDEDEDDTLEACLLDMERVTKRMRRFL